VSGIVGANPCRSRLPPVSAGRYQPLGDGGKSSFRRTLKRCNSSTAHCGSVGEVTSFPSLLDHRLLPLLPRRQHLSLIPADLRLHHFQLRADQQAHLPTELVGEQGRSRPRRFLWRQNMSPSGIGVPSQSGCWRTWRAIGAGLEHGRSPWRSASHQPAQEAFRDADGQTNQRTQDRTATRPGLPNRGFRRPEAIEPEKG
jgi:hypothetical protein